MFEQEQKRFVRQAASVLPGAEARDAFARYVAGAVRDLSSPEDGFAPVAEQLGGTAEQAARDFLDSQPPEVVERWRQSARRANRRRWIAVGVVIAVLAAIVAFYVATKGVLIVNTETTYYDFSDTDLTAEEQLELVMKLNEEKHAADSAAS